MRHYVLTRSVYGSHWDLQANRRRLAITAGVTVASLAAQTCRDWTWLVAMAPDDALRDERRSVFESAGVPVVFVDFDPGKTRRLTRATFGDVAYAAYRAPWPIGPRNDQIWMTRLDDDDAFTPDAFARLRSVTVRGRRALMFPIGYRVMGTGYTPVRHMSNAMHTLVTPPGDALDVYDYGHRAVARAAHVKVIDEHPAWLWVRHPDSISGWKAVENELTPEIRGLFPIDWSVLNHPWRPQRTGRVFT